MAMSQQTAQTKSHCQVHWQGTEIPAPTQDTAIDPHLVIAIGIGIFVLIIGTGIDLAGQDPILSVMDTGVTVEVSHAGVTPDHTADPHTAAHHTTETEADTAIDKKTHIEDPHHTKVSPEITVDPDHIHHTKTIT